MRLTCTNCKQPVQIDDTKVPDGLFKIKCPKCGKIITAQKEAASNNETVTAPPPSSSPGLDHGEISPAIEAYVKREVASMKREITGALSALFGGDMNWKFETEGPGEETQSRSLKRALICEDDQVFVDMITTAVKRLGFGIDVARSTAEAIKKVEQNFYHLITVDYVFPDDKDGGTRIIGKINAQKPAQRRQQFVVLISSNVKSADANAAFFHGANITVNKEEINNLEGLISDGQRNFQQIYNVFNKILADKNERL